MNFIDAIKSYVKNWIKFSGRSSRSEYWWATLFSNIINYLIAYYLLLITTLDDSASLGLVPLLLTSVLIFLTIASSALAFRRLHDINKSGLIYIITLVLIFIASFSSTQNIVQSAFFDIIQIIFCIVLIGLFCVRGKLENNKYGPNPLFIDKPIDSNPNNENNNLIEEKTIWDENK